jgi:hypothetical protein
MLVSTAPQETYMEKQNARKMWEGKERMKNEMQGK